MNVMLQSFMTVAIIATILVFFVLGPIIRFLDQAEVAARKANKHNIATALEVYYASNGRYPPADSLSDALKHLHEHGYLSDERILSNDLEYHVSQNGRRYSFQKPTTTRSAVERLYHQ